MKSKKEYLMKLLNSLQKSRPLAKGLLILIKENQIDEKTIETVSDMMIQTVDTIVEKKHQQKVQEGIEKLKHITAKEERHREQQTATKELESKIDNL